MLTTAPRGTRDLLPGEVEKWHYLEETAHRICSEYGYREIRTPIFEHTELFQRGIGETTDIVEKEMYTFLDRGERSITLRPEGTASTVRAFIEHKLYNQPQPTKLYYLGPMFRYDRPQAGRYRQFHQFGIEAIGSDDPALDAEVVSMAMEYYHRLGLTNLELHLNSIGCPDCRPVYREKLKEFLRPNLQKLCANCQQRYERNPIRIIDCKLEACQEIAQGAPTTVSCLCPVCAEHFAQVKHYLELLEISFIVDERLVRGLDYYTRTAFEIMAPGIGAQNSIGGGGRYDGLIEECGGPPVPGIGFALGLERILITLEKQGVVLPSEPEVDAFVATTGEATRSEAFRLLAMLRRSGLKAEMDYLDRSLKAQLKYANKLGVRFTIIAGETELSRGVVVVKDMGEGTQQELPVAELRDYLLNRRLERICE